MFIFTILLIYTFCNIVKSKELTTTHQINIQLPQPPISAYIYPYQEDFISTVQFLKDETPNKKNKVGSLIKLLKKALTNYIDVLKDEKTGCNDGNVVDEDTKEIKKEFSKENNSIFGKNEQVVINENEMKEVKTENIFEEIYEINNNTFETEKHLENNLNNVPEERIETSVISVTDFIVDDPINYMRNFKAKPVYYRNQQDNYVLERPEPKIMDTFDSQVEKVVKIGRREKNRNVATKTKRNKLKKESFSIPCVKVSDILDDTLHIPKEAYCNKQCRPEIISNAQDIQSTLENPLLNRISITSESDDTVAMLFKPKTISLMQAYGNMLKKITVTVLIPFHVTKLIL